MPVVQLAQDDPHSPERTRILDVLEIRHRFLDPRVGFILIGPPGNCVNGAPRRTPGRMEVADHHVVKEHVVQPPRSQPATHQVSVNVEDRHV